MLRKATLPSASVLPIALSGACHPDLDVLERPSLTIGHHHRHRRARRSSGAWLRRGRDFRRRHLRRLGSGGCLAGVPEPRGGLTRKDRGVPWRFAWLYLIAGSEFRQASAWRLPKADSLLRKDMPKVTSKSQVTISIEERLRLFDRATARQKRRQREGSHPPVGDSARLKRRHRGWSREDLDDGVRFLVDMPGPRPAEQTLPKPLRLWPGVIAVVLGWVVMLFLPEVAPSASLLQRSWRSRRWSCRRPVVAVLRAGHLVLSAWASSS